MSSSASKKRKFQKDNRESASRDSVVTTSADTDSNFKSKTKISIGQEIWRWCKLKSDRNLKSHCEVAKLLLDIYEVHTKKRIFPDLSEDDSDSSSVEDGSDDAQPPTATISKTPSEEASSSTGHNQIVQVKIETVDIHQEADPHIITELATARTCHIPLIVKTEYADPEQTFSEHGKIQVPGIPEACFPNKEEPPSEQDIKLQVPSNQTYALAPESFDSAIHIEHAVEEESENEAEVHDTQKMEVNAAMETAKNQSKSRSSRVKSRNLEVKHSDSHKYEKGPMTYKSKLDKEHKTPQYRASSRCNQLTQLKPGPSKEVDVSGHSLANNMPTQAESDSSIEMDIEPVHLQTSDSKAFRCGYPDCNYSTSSKYNMECHTMTHSEDMPTKCKMCHKTLADNCMLKCHIELSHNNTVFMCEFCGSTYRTSGGLTLHKKSHHVMQFKFRCDFCGKGYQNKDEWSAHHSKHLGIKLHECDKCHKRYTSKATLRRHKKGCHKGRSFICEECGKGYPNQSSLTEHKKGKHKGRFYFCKCGKTLSWRATFNKHKNECMDVNPDIT